ENVGTVDGRIRGLGGWAIDAQSLYDPVTSNVWTGDGTLRNSGNVYPSINVVAGTRYVNNIPPDGVPAKDATFWSVTDLATMPDGSLLAADYVSNVVSRIDTNGELTRFLGNGLNCAITFQQPACILTPQPAKDVAVGAVVAIAPGVDGCVYA